MSNEQQQQIWNSVLQICLVTSKSYYNDWQENECRRTIGCFGQVHLSTPAISLPANDILAFGFALLPSFLRFLGMSIHSTMLDARQIQRRHCASCDKPCASHGWQHDVSPVRNEASWVCSFCKIHAEIQGRLCYPWFPCLVLFLHFQDEKSHYPLWGIESHVELRRNARTYLQQIVRLIPRTIRSKLQSLHTGSAQLIALASGHVERVGPLDHIGPLDDQRITFDPVWSFLLTHLKIFKDI